MAPARSSTRTLAISVVLMSAALPGCGARSELREGAPEDTGTDLDGGVDASPPIDAEPPVEPECDPLKPPPDGASCEPLEFTMGVAASCTVGTKPGAVLDAEGLLTDVDVGERVLALDRWGKGHLLASCDSTLAALLWDKFDVEGHLGQTEGPRVASVGFFFPCDPASGPLEGYDALPETVTHLGEDLPAFYKGAPDLLAADWDVLVLCGKNIGVPLSAWQPEIQSFVTEHGKGLMVLMDYHKSMTDDWFFDEMNAVVEGSDVFFEKVFLKDGNMSVCACVPDLPPPP